MKLYFDKLDQKHVSCNHMDVSENSGTPKSSTLKGFSIINHPFWGTPIFGNTYMQNYVLISTRHSGFMLRIHTTLRIAGHLKVVARILSTAPFENFGLWDLYLRNCHMCIHSTILHPI